MARRRALHVALLVLSRVLLAAGVLAVTYTGYQLFGTGFAERHSQQALRREAAQDIVRPAGTGNAGAALAGVDDGHAVAVIQIPRIALTKVVVEGVGVGDLRRGPGHYPGTPLPGDHGNVAIAGHRTTYGAPFYRTNELQAGDPIFLTGSTGTYRYQVTGERVVSPSDIAVVGPTADDRLTLTTCYPRFSAAERLIISAALVGPAPDAAPAWLATARGSSGTIQQHARPAAASLHAALAEGSATHGSWPLTIAWGGGLAVLWLAASWLGTRWGRLTYLAASPAGLAVTWVFFTHLEKVFPSSF